MSSPKHQKLPFSLACQAVPYRLQSRPLCTSSGGMPAQPHRWSRHAAYAFSAKCLMFTTRLCSPDLLLHSSFKHAQIAFEAPADSCCLPPDQASFTLSPVLACCHCHQTDAPTLLMAVSDRNNRTQPHPHRTHLLINTQQCTRARSAVNSRQSCHPLSDAGRRARHQVRQSSASWDAVPTLPSLQCCRRAVDKKGAGPAHQLLAGQSDSCAGSLRASGGGSGPPIG